MKQIVITVIILLAISIHPSLSGACTSFAVYSDKTLYGMNFDYSPDVLQKFTISSSIQGKVFQMASRAPFGFADVAGMNIKGLFASCQMLFPEGKAPAARSTNQISTAVFHQMALSRFDKLPQVENFLNKRKVVHTIGVSLHNLVADRFGDAMVVEVGETKNQITRIQDRFIVMTNFPNYQLKGKSYEEADGYGADRFRIAHKYIRSNFKDFDIEKGIEVLKLARNTSESYPTRCSMVFDPNKKEIYICLEKNVHKIWKVSLENQTIETHRGFASFKGRPIPAEGLLATELAQW